MALKTRQVRALRVAFLTNSAFDKENRESAGKLKKRALSCIQRNVRYPVYEDSNRPDAVFYIIRDFSSKGWLLRKCEDRT